MSNTSFWKEIFMLKEKNILFLINLPQYITNAKTSSTNNIIPNGIRNEITLIVFILNLYTYILYYFLEAEKLGD